MKPLAAAALDAGVRQVRESGTQLPPILTPQEFADLIDRSCGAIYHWSGTPKLHGAARRRGRHLLIWRDRALTLAAGGRIPTPRSDLLELSDAEIAIAFASQDPAQRWPLLLSPERLAAYLHVGRSSIYRWMAFGYLEGTFVRRSDGVRFFRDPLIKTLFNGKLWT